MRLRRIVLRNFRGVAQSQVEFGDTVTVVQGPNEVGKSSIAEALRLIRSEKDSSQKGCVRSAQPVGTDVGPEVEIELRSGGFDMTYRKRWLRSRLTELRIRAPKPEQLTGEQAHARFREILEHTVDLQLLEALDIVQGSSLDQPKLAAVNALHRALDDSEPDGGSQDALMARIEAEYAKYFTRTGKKTGRLKELDAEVATLEARVAELESQSTEMDEFTAEFADRQSERRRLEQELTAATDEWRAARQAAEQVNALRERGEAARQERNAAQERLTLVRQADDNRTGQINELSKRTRDAETGKTRSEQCRGALEQAETRLKGAQETATALDATRRQAHLAAVDAQSALDVRIARTERDRLAAQLEHARTAERRRLEAAAQLKNLTIDDEQVSELAALETALVVARRSRDAAAAHVSVRSLGEHPITVDGTVLPAGAEHRCAVLSQVHIEVPDVVSIDVSPGTPPAELDRELAEASAAVDTALAALEVTSVGQARELAGRRRTAKATLDQAQASLAALLGSRGLGEVEEQLAEVTARIEQSAAAPGDDAPVNSLREAAEQARNAEEDLGTQWDLATTQVARYRQEAEHAREVFVHASAEFDAAVRELDVSRQLLAQARETASDGSLREAVEQAEIALRAAEQALRDADSELIQADPDQVAMTLANCEELVASRKDRLSATATRLTELQALIDDRAKAGIYDELSRAKAAQEAAAASQNRLQRAADAVALLRDTMVRHRVAVQRRYVAPFRDHLERLGKVVFGADFQVEISPELTVQSRTLHGATVPFGSLSAGAREQIALLGRLASAQLVDSGEGAPVILDDSLGYADPVRLRRLNIVLNDVGHSAQVIILTCQPDRFGSIGGAKVVQLNPASGGAPGRALVQGRDGALDQGGADQ